MSTPRPSSLRGKTTSPSSTTSLSKSKSKSKSESEPKPSLSPDHAPHRRLPPPSAQPTTKPIPPIKSPSPFPPPSKPTTQPSTNYKLRANPDKKISGKTCTFAFSTSNIVNPNNYEREVTKPPSPSPTPKPIKCRKTTTTTTTTTRGADLVSVEFTEMIFG